MIINKLDNDYIIKIYKPFIKDINIYNIDEVYSLIKSIIKRIIKKNNILGTYIVNAYLNELYGMIIEFNKLEDNDYIDIKLNFHLNSIFLYEIDINYLNNNHNDIYYYSNKYYLLPKTNNPNLLEASNIIYGKKAYDIIKKGIKLST